MYYTLLIEQRPNSKDKNKSYLPSADVPYILAINGGVLRNVG